jgi:geranylgeranyl pyrophosphate synthase
MNDGLQRELLRNEIELAISSLSKELRGLVSEPLTVSRRGLAVASEHEAPWILLPLITCESICGHNEEAMPLCASLQFFIAAGDVFDDVEDNDSPLSLSAKYGLAITNNIATTLLVLGEKAIARLKDKNVGDKKIVRLLDTINYYYLTACTGQHKDLLYGKEIDISEKDYLDILALKSASQIECACYTGALLATDNEDLLNIFKDFGYNLGMMAQIMNDISGIIDKKDIINKKITLPVIFALSQTEEPSLSKLERYYKDKIDNDIAPEQISDIISNSGAMYYAAVKMEYYRVLMSEAIEKAENHGIDSENLKVFLK